MLLSQHVRVWPSGQTRFVVRSPSGKRVSKKRTSTQGVFALADYRCSVKDRLSRSKGASVARAVAYIAREKLEDERTGEVYDFSGNKDKALWTGIYAPSGAPEWAHDLQKLTNEIERAEKRKDSQLALPLELSLAHELTLEQNRWMMQDFITENFTRKGYATIAAIHEPPHGGDERNIHAHLLVTLRTIDENGFSKTKAEQQDNYMARSERVEDLRVSWEKHLKHHLERQGFEKEAAEVSCKSLKERGIDRDPQQHLGPTASDMERKGKQTERGDLNRARQERNHGLEKLNKEHVKLEKEIAALEREERKTRERKPQQVQESQRQAEAERRAQEMQKRNAASAAAIRGAWTSAPRDGLAFMIGLNERGLYVAEDERGNYFAVEKSGFAHRLPDKDMQQAVDALRRENSGLVIPTLEEQRTELQQQRDQLEDERERERQRQAMHTGATLYNRASMPIMQRDALRHIQDAREHREAVQRRQEREKKKQERADAKTKKQPHGQKQEAQEQQQERQREENKEAPRDQAAQKREDKKDRTEQTEYQQRRAEREALREQLGLRQQGGKERDDGGKEREREL